MTKLFLTQQPKEGILRLNREYKKRLLKVMRMKAGESLLVFTSGKKLECRIQQILQDGILLEVTQELEAPQIPILHLTLGQAIPKGDRFEWLIQKATELGVTEICPLITERTIVKPASVSGKVQRWNEIAEHSAGQSENLYPTRIHPPQSLQSFLQGHSDSKLRLLLHERKSAVSLRDLLKTRSDIDRITFVVGPEGGWSDAETEQILAAGYQMIHLGSRILRAETSGLVMATLLQYELGDFRKA